MVPETWENADDWFY
ncbi:hypothetical protein [Enterobacter hormaechei]